jgi:hypothetical protein
MRRDIPAFEIGARVRLRPDGAENWIDPKLQRRAKNGTPGTVQRVIGTAVPPRDRDYFVAFDKVGRLPPISEFIPARELEAMADA